MSTGDDRPHDGSGDGSDDESRGEQPNPFKGTPFEQLFGQMGGAGGMGGMGDLGEQLNRFSQQLGGQMPDLTQLFGQIQAMMAPHDGPLNWDLALDTARKTVAQDPDPSPTQKQKDAVADAVRLADHWLDDATELPSGITSTTAWSRAEWVVATSDTWRHLVEPIAKQSVEALSSALPEEARAMSGPLVGMLGKVIGGMLAGQTGSGIGTLAKEVLSVSDVGVPLAPAGKAALVPANVTAFAEGLDVTEDDVLLYLALGAIGLPVFAEHTSGLGTFTQPSAGYLLSFPVAALVAGNEAGARRLVERELGALADPDPSLDRLRETVAAFLAHGASVEATAAELFVHKNTVRYRVAQAEDLLGHPLSQRRTEVAVALACLERFGPGRFS